MRKLLLTILPVLLVAASAFGQSRQVSGVVSGTDGAPIAGVTVVVEGGVGGTTTGLDGRYAISAPAQGTLTFTFIGMETQQIAIAGRAIVNVTMSENAVQADDVVVTAYGGSASKRDLTGSVASVGSKDIQMQTVSTASRALDGTMAGVRITTASGQPGSEATIYVRGLGSLNASASALVVVDGVPYSGSLSSINPADIASISVSKDAASNSIYGARAANGVVMVTTKSGARSQKGQITYEQRFGFNERGVPLPDRVGPGEYYEWMWAGLRNYAKVAGGYDDARAAAFAQSNLPTMAGNYMSYRVPNGEALIDPATGKLNANAELLYFDDWEKELSVRALRQEYNLSVSGGNDRTDYYASLGYLDDPSYIIGSKFDRYSGRVAVNSQVNDWFRVSANAAYARRTTVGLADYNGAWNTNNPFFYAAVYAPIFPVYARDLNGNYKYRPDGRKMFDYGTGETDSPLGTTGNLIFPGMNPVAYMELDRFENVVDNFSTRLSGEIAITKQLKITGNLAMDNFYSNQTSFQNNQEGITADPSINGQVSKARSSSTTLNSTQLISYINTFCDLHNVDLLAGHEFYSYKTGGMSATKINMFVPGVAELDNFVTVDGNPSSNSFDEAIDSYLFLGRYNYDQKYYLSASARMDGSSNFKYDKWGTFWSVGAAWRLSSESWLENADWMDDLKLRASYGTSGNRSVTNRNFPYTDLWNVVPVGDGIGISQSSTGNRDLTWELNKQFDLGVDFRFWGRLTGTIDYYTRNTTSMIWNRPTPASTGLTARLENVGELRNSGFEFELSYDIFQTQDLYWNVSLNASTNNQELVSIPEEFMDPYVSGGYLRGTGKSYYNLYQYKYAGVNPEDGTALFYTRDDDGKNIKVSYADAVAAGDAKSKYEIGDALADWEGGFNTSFRYKNFDVAIYTSFQTGGLKSFEEWRQISLDGRPGMAITRDRFENSWSAENTNAKYPRPYYNGPNDGIRGDIGFRDASFFSLRSVNIGYTFPQRWMDAIKVSSARIYLSGDNLWLKSAEKGFDPRSYIDPALQTAGFAQQRTYSMGINITF